MNILVSRQIEIIPSRLSKKILNIIFSLYAAKLLSFQSDGFLLSRPPEK